MAREPILLGVAPAGTGGDTARQAFTKVNSMTAELYAADSDLDTRVQALEDAPPAGTVTSVAGVSPDGAGNVPTATLKSALNVPTAPGDIGAATAAQGAKADSAVQPAALNAGLDTKVDKVTGLGLSQESFTTAEKAKLAGLESSLFLGVYVSIAALEAAHPSPVEGNYAFVDPGTGDPIEIAIWDATDADWTMAAGGSMTPAQIKTAYESNPDTNAFTDAEQAKLAGIAPGATMNQTDSYLTNRANHTGTQAASTISDFAATTRATTLTGLDTGTAADVTAADSILSAFGKLQARIAGMFSKLSEYPNAPSASDGKNYWMRNRTWIEAVLYKLFGYWEVVESGTGASLDLAVANVFKRVLTGNFTPTLTGATNGQCHSFTLQLENGSSYTVTWPASFKWLSGVPTLTAKDVITGFSTDGGTTWIVNYAGSYV